MLTNTKQEEVKHIIQHQKNVVIWQQLQSAQREDFPIGILQMMADLDTYIVKLLKFHFKSYAQKFQYRLYTAQLAT